MNGRDRKEERRCREIRDNYQNLLEATIQVAVHLEM
jgi:hypothetical protein